MDCWEEYVIKDVHISDDDDNAKEQGATRDAFRRKSAEAPCLRLCCCCCCTFKIHDDNESGTTPSAFYIARDTIQSGQPHVVLPEST